MSVRNLPTSLQEDTLNQLLSILVDMMGHW
jgi:hypothetical protein